MTNGSYYFRFEIDPGGERVRIGPLERLLTAATPAAPVDDWRRDCVRLLGGESIEPPTAAQLALCAEYPAASPPREEATVFLATPVHARASLTSVYLPPGGIVQPTADDAAALSADFARSFADARMRLIATADAALVLSMDGVCQVRTADPVSALGRDLRGFLPGGPDAGRVARLQAEIEMWLHEHAVNRAREARGEPPITGLWLWAGGSARWRPVACPVNLVGVDPMFSRWVASQGATAAAHRGTLVVVAATQCASPDLEAMRMLREAARALRRGRVGAVHVCAAGLRYDVVRAPRWRPWRRPRPWWEYFDEPR